MKNLSVVVGIAAAAASLFLVGWAPATPRYVFNPPVRQSKVDMDALAKALREYGIWREQHDRDTFPVDMPRAGETYDRVTGNAIRR